MQLHGHDIAVCSWSLQPRDMADLVGKVQQLGLSHVQLALGELAMLDVKLRNMQLAFLQSAGIHLTGGMLHFKGEDYSSIDRIRQTGGFIPDGEWPQRRQITIEVAKLGERLGVKTIMSHVGFVPAHDDPKYPAALNRVREVATIFGDQGLDLIMETGQEPAADLLNFFGDLGAANVQINFDPANMILYGAGDPVEAIRLLGSHIRHVHVKDAIASANPGVDWGQEVPFGTGQVGPDRFLKALHEVGYTGPLAIEREAGDNRFGDVRAAIDALRAAKAD